MAHKPVPASALKKPLSLTRPSEKTAEQAAVKAVLNAIYSSKNPVVLVDSLILQFGLKALVRSLLDDLKFSTFCPFMGKSVIEETKPYFYGTYNGKFSYPGIQEAVEEDSDLVIHIGPLPTDMNTGGYSAKIDPSKLVLVEETKVIFKGEVFEGVYMESCKSSQIPLAQFIVVFMSSAVLTGLANSLDISKVPKTAPLALPVIPLRSYSEINGPLIT
jgi:pyruvate decarboxylase